MSAGLCILPGARFLDHIASPDAHLDYCIKQVRMYFHGSAVERPGQWTGIALSAIGLDFTASPQILERFYFRTWWWRGHHYALAKNFNAGSGELYRSGDGPSAFESRGDFLKDVRRSAVLIRGYHLLIFYSRVGDAPERILLTSVDMRLDWREWEPSEPIEVLARGTGYEGIVYPIEVPNHGSAVGVHQLRDPCIFQDGRPLYFYTIGGEMGIAGAEIVEMPFSET